MPASVLVTLDQLDRPVPGGIGTYARELVRSVAAVNPPDRPTLAAALGRHAAADGSFALDALGVERRLLPLPVSLLTRLWDAGLVSLKGGDEVVHATSLAVPPKPRRGRLVVTVHDLCWRSFPEAYPARGRRWHEAALQRALSRADALVVPSDAVREDLLGAGAVAGRVEVIEHGCDHLPPIDSAASAAYLRRAGVSGDYLLAVGTLEPRKNLRRLMAAYSSIRPDLPGEWPLLVVGQAGWGEAMTPVPGVVLGGRATPVELPGLYAGSRCLAYVPLGEGFGFPVVEAMAVGTPVASSQVPAAGGASLEVDPLDPASIARGLLEAGLDGPTRSRLAVAGSERAATLTWRVSAERHIALWSRLIGETSAAS